MKFDLVTPEKLFASDENVQYVACPGSEGDFGVLPGHMPFISTLRQNAPVKVTLADGTEKTFTVSGGFAEVSATGVTVLAERAEAL
ncbi:MAG: ATP synthase F1 subunit epsilon [Alphaproteobacteria bacterium]